MDQEKLDTKGTQRFYISKKHPDFKVFERHSYEARRLWNTLNKVMIEKQNLRNNPKCQAPVANSLGIDFNKNMESWRKVIMSAMDIDLPIKIAQNITRSLQSTWTSVISLRSKGKKTGNPQMNRGNYGVAPYNPQAISRGKTAVRENRVIPTGCKAGFELPDDVRLEQVQSCRVIRRPDGFELHVLYTKRIQPTYVAKNVFAAGDLGVDNLLTLITTDGARPKIVSGKELKSYNRLTNKKNGELSRLKATAKSNSEKAHYAKKIERLWFNRDKKMRHELTTAANAVVRYLMEYSVSEFVIGWNENFKSNSNMGKINNQNFVGIPHAYFRDLLQVKCEEVGIKFTVQEESFTSKASYFDNDIMPAYVNGQKMKFSGKRISRGVYRTSNGTLIHADVNSAWNILYKCKPSIGRNSGIVVFPERLSYAS